VHIHQDVRDRDHGFGEISVDVTNDGSLGALKTSCCYHWCQYFCWHEEEHANILIIVCKTIDWHVSIVDPISTKINLQKLLWSWVKCLTKLKKGE